MDAQAVLGAKRSPAPTGAGEAQRILWRPQFSFSGIAAWIHPLLPEAQQAGP